MNDIFKNKKVLIIIGVVLVFVIGTSLFFFNRLKSSNQVDLSEVLEEEEVIPTVDSSVVVSLKSATGKKEVILTVKNAPKGTSTVEYELSYDARGQGPQGSIGSIELNNNERSFERKITLGTCSSGTCVYHDVTSAVRVSLKFIGSYGERIFEKEYDL